MIFGKGVNGCVAYQQIIMYMCGTVVIFLSLFLQDGSAYNVDIEGAMVHSGEVGSMFGYSVAQHIDQSTSWLLIGAPKAQTSQPGIVKGGAVYRCTTNTTNYCREIPFDESGNNLKYVARINDYREIDDKSNQWFGATVQSSGRNGVIVACAPRYVYLSKDYNKREPVGTCYISKPSTTRTEEFSPCRREVDRRYVADQYHKQGYCQSGFSATITSDGQKMMVAAVGSWYWQGQLYNYEVKNKEYVSTREGPPEEDDSYMGYASAVGDFDGDNIEDYVVSIPKGDLHLGRVAMFTQNLTNIQNITGEQVGAYFGYSLAVADLDGDELDDIIVGAPFYAVLKTSKTYETGRVYIFYQTEKHKFKPSKKDILDGKESMSRFGHALTRLGDINYDGYNDLAVGAPYAGEDHKGAVYIYHGSKKGIITQVSQIIYPKDLDPGLTTFGYSLSGGIDQDGNTYPDLLVGAYGADKAVFLRTRPVVRVYASLKIDPVIINLDHRSCSLIDDKRVTCLTVYTCLEYTGQGVAEELFFDLTWELDTLQRNRSGEQQRAYYLTTEKDVVEKNTVKLTKKATWCTSSFAYVLDDISDKLTPIAVDFKFALRKLKSGSRSRKRRSLEPILDQYIRTSVRTEAQILKNCGRDNVCYPDLRVHSIRVSRAHVIGTTTELEILIMVENRGEDAFNTHLYINLPQGVSIKGIQGVQSVQGVAPVSCDRMTINNEDVVTCDLGNPLPAQAKTNFTLKASPKHFNETKDHLVFALEVNSTNPENLTDTVNNYASVSIPVTAAAEILINGKSTPEQIIVNTTRVRLNGDRFRTRPVEHLYQVQNLGPSSTETIDLQIYWPSHDNDGEPILPLSGAPEVTKGNGQCQIIFVTPANSSDILRYSLSDPNDVVMVLQEQRSGDRPKRANKGRVTCTDWCTVIKCTVGYLKRNDNFLLKIKANLMVDEFIRNQMPHALLTSTAFARVVSMPYKLKAVDPTSFATAKQSIVTDVNIDKPDIGGRPIEIWIIAVAVSAGLLVLLLIIILLWWCGFFKRRKPEDDGYLVANGNPRNIEDKTFE
ncbi:integrin alpha-8-like [Haliotis asinina]|uniref:integrin alpha-8-like n=1 Tax=Haliotis asinina TaxID=109174 RepID=UPI0035327ADD